MKSLKQSNLLALIGISAFLFYLDGYSKDKKFRIGYEQLHVPVDATPNPAYLQYTDRLTPSLVSLQMHRFLIGSEKDGKGLEFGIFLASFRTEFKGGEEFRSAFPPGVYGVDLTYNHPILSRFKGSVRLDFSVGFSIASAIRQFFALPDSLEIRELGINKGKAEILRPLIGGGIFIGTTLFPNTPINLIVQLGYVKFRSASTWVIEGRREGNKRFYVPSQYLQYPVIKTGGFTNKFGIVLSF